MKTPAKRTRVGRGGGRTTCCGSGASAQLAMQMQTQVQTQV